MPVAPLATQAFASLRGKRKAAKAGLLDDADEGPRGTDMFGLFGDVGCLALQPQSVM